jgi:competence protein ComFB
MTLRERYNIDKLRNRTLEMVMAKVEQVLEEGLLCPCEDCVLDLVAFALNRVTPLYATSLLEPLHPNKAKEKKVLIEIDLSINAGLKRIARHPHHTNETSRAS